MYHEAHEGHEGFGSKGQGTPCPYNFVLFVTFVVKFRNPASELLLIDEEFL
jgi:hypothetical protein